MAIHREDGLPTLLLPPRAGLRQVAVRHIGVAIRHAAGERTEAVLQAVDKVAGAAVRRRRHGRFLNKLRNEIAAALQD